MSDQTPRPAGGAMPPLEPNEKLDVAKLLEGIEMLEEGRCSAAYLDELTKLGEVMQLASKCGLGQSSPNAFLSIVSHFQDELMGRTHGLVR